MEVLAASHSSYPRIGTPVEKQAHREAYAKLERGEISMEEFERVEDQVVQEVVGEQVAAGLDIVTDGQVRWYDPISHMARRMTGCEIDGLLRFFDTNFYFRQPVVKGRIARREPIVLPEFCFARGVSERPVKAVLTGPYTLARLSINRCGAAFEAIAKEFAAAISEEVEDLSRAGAEIIQVEEPAILKHSEDIPLLESLLGEICERRGNSEIILTTYFGDAAQLYGKLMKMPVDGLGFDFTYSQKLPDTIARLGCTKNLALGIVDGRNTRMEKTEEALPILDKILPSVGSEKIYVTTSCGLGDYLPREVAFKKLQKTAEIARIAREMVE
ncbi:MAG: hypothetical protein ACK4GQ_03790 [Candidatus Hadarchaeales archaeon]